MGLPQQKPDLVGEPRRAGGGGGGVAEDLLGRHGEEGGAGRRADILLASPGCVSGTLQEYGDEALAHQRHQIVQEILYQQINQLMAHL